MNIVIEISSYDKEWITNGYYIPEEINMRISEAIANSTPLPTGHGRLIDADELLKAIDTWDKFGYTETGCFVREPDNDYVPYIHYEDVVKSVSGAETIISADKAERREQE